MTTREVMGTGLRYADEATDAGELLLALGRCTPRQQQVLALWLGRRSCTQARIAKALGVSVITVKRDAMQAMERMIGLIWED